MSQASEIAATAADADAATRTAELLTDLVEDEADAMLYTFEDDSVLVIRDARWMDYEDIDAARKALGL